MNSSTAAKPEPLKYTGKTNDQNDKFVNFKLYAKLLIATFVYMIYSSVFQTVSKISAFSDECLLRSTIFTRKT